MEEFVFFNLCSHSWVETRIARECCFIDWNVTEVGAHVDRFAVYKCLVILRDETFAQRAFISGLN
jgi:hypothetical protein